MLGLLRRKNRKDKPADKRAAAVVWRLSMENEELREQMTAEAERAAAREEHLRCENSKLLDAVEYTPTERELALAAEVKELKSRAATEGEVDDLIVAAKLAYDLTGELPARIIDVKSPPDETGIGHGSYFGTEPLDVKAVRDALSDALGAITLPQVDQASAEAQAVYDTIMGHGELVETEYLLTPTKPIPMEVAMNPVASAAYMAAAQRGKSLWMSMTPDGSVLRFREATEGEES